MFVELKNYRVYQVPKKGKLAYYDKIIKNNNVVVNVITNTGYFIILNRIWENPFGGGFSNNIMFRCYSDIIKGTYIIAKSDYELMKKHSVIGSFVTLNKDVLSDFNKSILIEKGNKVKVKNVGYYTDNGIIKITIHFLVKNTIKSILADDVAFS